MRLGIPEVPPTRSSVRRFVPSRRHFLTLSGVAGLSVATAACSEPPIAAPVPLEPDELSVNRAIEAARALQKAALALAEARPELATLLRQVAATHEEHLVALGSPSKPATPTPSASSSPSPTASPAAPPTAIQLVKAEFGAARTALRDGLAAAPAFAVLFCRIAAARAVNADLVAAAASRPVMGVLEPAPEAITTPTTSGSSASSGSSAGSASGSAPATTSAAATTSGGTTTSTGTTTTSGGTVTETGTTTSNPATSGPTTTGSTPGNSATPTPVELEELDEPAGPIEIALDRLLAGEHAAVFAYPLLVARAGSGRRTLASTLWQIHRTDRDDLSRRLISAGVRPTVAEPAYDVGTAPSTAAKTAALAARIENGLAALATDLLAASAGNSPSPTGTPTSSPGPDDAVNGDLLFGADQLVLSARRAAAWSGRPDAFPGQIVRTPATPTASPSATG
jgi:hypothetical protein